jgi:hypothetical protein
VKTGDSLDRIVQPVLEADSHAKVRKLERYPRLPLWTRGTVVQGRYFTVQERSVVDAHLSEPTLEVERRLPSQ